MIKIRNNTFETNSSSTHSMVIAMADDFSKWVKGETLYCRYNSKFFEKGKFYDIEFVTNCIKEHNPEYADDPEEMYYEYDLYTYERYCEDLEIDEHTFTTPSGEVIKTLCRYGYDG